MRPDMEFNTEYYIFRYPLSRFKIDLFIEDVMVCKGYEEIRTTCHCLHFGNQGFKIVLLI